MPSHSPVVMLAAKVVSLENRDTAKTNEIGNLKLALETERRERKEAEEQTRAEFVALTGAVSGSKAELSAAIRTLRADLRKDLAGIIQANGKATAATKTRAGKKGKGPQLGVVSDYPVDASAIEAFGPTFLTANSLPNHKLAEASRNELRRWLRETWQSENKAFLKQYRAKMWGIDTTGWEKFLADVSAAFELRSQGDGVVVVRRKSQ